MTLILSSCDFRNEHSCHAIHENLPKPIEHCRLLFIPNEKATAQAIHGDLYVKRMQEFGFSRENIDIFDYDAPQDFRDLNIDVLYISGGNTFKTLARIRKCGFDEDVIRYVSSGVTYIGGSAGAHIATMDISHVALYDDVPDDMNDFRGLGLFNGIFICHYSPDRQTHRDALITENQYKIYTMTDDEFMVIKSEKTTL